MAALHPYWIAGQEAAQELLREAFEGFKDSKHIFVAGDEQMGPDDSRMWLYFQIWFVEWRVLTAAFDKPSDPGKALVRKFYDGFADTIYFTLSEGKSNREALLELDQRCKALTKHIDTILGSKERMPLLEILARLAGIVWFSVQKYRSGELSAEEESEFTQAFGMYLIPFSARLLGRINNLGLKTLADNYVEAPAEPWDYSKWPRVEQKDRNSLASIEKIELAKLEDMSLQTTSIELKNILTNCTDKHEFAKLYKLHRRDMWKVIEKMRITQSDRSDALRKAGMLCFEIAITHKLARMAEHFKKTWSEDIEVYAGKDDFGAETKGCIVSLAIWIGVATAALGLVLIALAW